MELVILATLGTIVSALAVSLGAARFSTVKRSVLLWTIAVVVIMIIHAALLATTPPGLVLSNTTVLVSAVVLGSLIAATARGGWRLGDSVHGHHHHACSYRLPQPPFTRSKQIKCN